MTQSKAAEHRWEEHRDRLLADLQGVSETVVQIPGWDPVGLEDGLRWLQASHYEAFKVEHNVQRDGDKATVVFKIWEDWEG